jgi:hypothetical protein
MANTPHLTTYKFRVSMGDEENPEVFLIHAVGRDVQQAEKLFAQRNWGATTSRPMTSAAAVAWASLTRTGRYSEDFDTFETEYLEVVPEETVTVTPTEPAPAPA